MPIARFVVLAFALAAIAVGCGDTGAIDTSCSNSPSAAANDSGSATQGDGGTSGTSAPSTGGTADRGGTSSSDPGSGTTSSAGSGSTGSGGGTSASSSAGSGSTDSGGGTSASGSGGSGTTSSTPAYDPHIVLSSNCNEWWIEATADAASMQYQIQGSTPQPMPPTSWGSFAANDNIPTGTQVRLIASRADGASAATLYFAFLQGSPQLDTSGSAGTTSGSGTSGGSSSGSSSSGGTSSGSSSSGGASSGGTTGSGSGSGAAGTTPPAGSPGDTMYVDGHFLYDACGNPVVLRGVNKMNIWTDPNGDSFPEIARTGANTVRIVWDTTGTASALDALIARALDNGLLPMVELHDATGNWSLLSSLVDYWVQPDIVAVLQRYQRTLLVNIGNEACGYISYSDFQSGYTQAVQRMRDAGINVPLVIDAVGWGSDIASVQTTGPALLQADPLHNLIFSVHIYWEGDPASTVTDAFTQSVNMNLPLIVGEFAPYGISCTNNVPYEAVIQAAQEDQIGWYAWSWGPGNTPCSAQDMTTDDTYDGLTGWGLEVAVTSPYSIANTAQPVPAVGNTTCP